MTHSLTHLEGFHEKIKANYRTLLLANTPEGLLRALSRMISSLEKDKKIKKSYQRVCERLRNENEGLQLHKEVASRWMISQLKKMSKLKCFKMPEVKKAIKFAELVISGKAYEISSAGFFSTIISYFEGACRAIAFYGPSSEIDEWLKIGLRENCLIYENGSLEGLESNKNFDPFSKSGRLIYDQLEHGFTKAKVLPKEYYFSQKETRCLIEWGDVQSITYPESAIIWRDSQNLQKSNTKYDHSPEHNLSYLLFLCEFEKLKPIPTCFLPKSKSLLEAESIVNGQHLQYHLSCFRTDDWGKVSTTKEEILLKLDRFLAFLQVEELEGEIVVRKGSRSLKTEAREFIENALLDAWKVYEKKGQIPKLYQDLINLILKAQLNAPSGIKEAISDRMIKTELRKFAKIKKWKPKRGKDRQKRHIA